MPHVAFTYYGAKVRTLPWLLPKLEAAGATHFVDVFGGSAAVSLNIKPHRITTYNDINSHVVNFFRVLREQPDELIRRLELTPYSREEWGKLWNTYTECPIERARLFFIKSAQSFNATQKHPGWSFTKVPGSVKSHHFVRHVSKMSEIIEAIRDWQIEHCSFEKVFTRYNEPFIMLYLDPPYEFKARKGTNKPRYAHEFTDDDHRHLAELANNTKSMVAISGYQSDLYEELYPASKGWRFHQSHKMPSGKGHKIECLWTNYDTKVPTQQTIF